MEWIYNKKLWWTVASGVIVALAAFIIGYNVGDSHGYAAKKAKIDGKTATYNELVSKIGGKKKELQDTKSKLKQTQEEYAQAAADLGGKQNQLSELETLKKNKDEIVGKVELSKDTLSDLKSQISDAKNKLATVTAGVQKADGEPKKLGAGIFYVGQDLQPGRYKVVPIGEGSNFAVWKPDGGLVASTILGDGGVPSFVFTAMPNQKIENNAPAKFIPVK